MSKAGSPAEPNWAVRTFTVALTICVAIYGFMGWAKSDQWLFATICIVAQGIANNASAQARRAIAKGRGISAVFMLVSMFGCAMFSSMSLEHAWAVDGTGAPLGLFDLSRASHDPMFWLFVFMALIEPAFYWSIEDIERSPYPLTPEQIADQALADMRGAAHPERKPWTPAFVGGSVLAGVAAVTAPMSTAAPIVTTNTGFATARDHALALHAASPHRTHLSIAQEVRTARTNVSRWIRLNGQAEQAA